MAPTEVCQQACDASAGAPVTCPVGYFCADSGHCDADCNLTTNPCASGKMCNRGRPVRDPNACSGIGCNVVDCAKKGKPPTTISGTVYAPNGTLPLYGINVYVPNDRRPSADGRRRLQSLRRRPAGNADRAVGHRRAATSRSPTCPPATNIPLVITSGKWRRQITIPTVDACADNALAAADTRLPKTKSEGDIPKIAITTGSADSLECLIRKLGIADSEITTPAGTGRIHLYAGNGVDQFAAGFAGGAGAIPSATPFWASANNLKAYDIVILSCEGQQNPDTKPQAAIDAMKAYADLGGRVFASHWHNVWIGGAYQIGRQLQTPAVWNNIATWNAGTNLEHRPRRSHRRGAEPEGHVFANWMLNVSWARRVRDEIQIQDRPAAPPAARSTPRERSAGRTSRAAATSRRTSSSRRRTRARSTRRCGKVVFSDMHVSGGPIANQSYPNSCVRRRDHRPHAAGEGARLHVLRHRLLRRSADSLKYSSQRSPHSRIRRR